MSREVDKLELMAVVWQDPPDEFLDSREHCQEVLNQAVLEVLTYIKLYENDDLTKKIFEDTSSPVYKFIEFIYANIGRIRTILGYQGVDASVSLTKELLDQYHIVDFFEIYKLEPLLRQPQSSSEFIGQ